MRRASRRSPHFSFDAVVRSHGWYDLPPFSYDRRRAILATRVAGRPSRSGPRGRLRRSGAAVPRRELRAAPPRLLARLELDAFDRALSGDARCRRASGAGRRRMLGRPTSSRTR
jgi:hypothetical protein